MILLPVAPGGRFLSNPGRADLDDVLLHVFVERRRRLPRPRAGADKQLEDLQISRRDAFVTRRTFLAVLRNPQAHLLRGDKNVVHRPKNELKDFGYTTIPQLASQSRSVMTDLSVCRPRIND